VWQPCELLYTCYLLTYKCISAAKWKASKPKKEPPALCYDCDYDPDDAQVKEKDNPGAKQKRGYGDWAAQEAGNGGGGGKTADSRRGFPRCALDSGDERFVRLTECHSSVCFIRRDHNGRAYSLRLRQRSGVL